MTKAELISVIADKTSVRKKEVTGIVEEVFETIADSLAKGEKCTFVGFGVFEVKERAAREGRNPQNPSQVVKIPAKKVPTFRAGKDLKNRVHPADTKKKK